MLSGRHLLKPTPNCLRFLLQPCQKLTTLQPRFWDIKKSLQGSKFGQIRSLRDDHHICPSHTQEKLVDFYGRAYYKHEFGGSDPPSEIPTMSSEYFVPNFLCRKNILCPIFKKLIQNGICPTSWYH